LTELERRRSDLLGTTDSALQYTKNKQVVCHTVASPFTLKKYLNAEEELWKFKYFTFQKYNLQKNPLKEYQNPSRYQNTL
jgi:hypothetical protein